MKKAFLFLMLCIGVHITYAQEVYTSSGRADHAQKKKKVSGYDPSKLILGGSASLGFGSDYADFGLSPFVGYRFSERFSAGVGVGYQYTKLPIALYDPSIGAYTTFSTKFNTITPNLWGRFFVWNNIFVSGIFENDFVNYKGYDNDNNGDIVSVKKNVYVPCMLLGAGVKQPIGGRTSAIAEILYDVVQNQYSPYLNTPVIRVTFCVGL